MLKTIQIYAQVFAYAIFIIAVDVIRSVQSFFGFGTRDPISGIPKERMFTVRPKNIDFAVLLFDCKCFGEACSNEAVY